MGQPNKQAASTRSKRPTGGRKKTNPQGSSIVEWIKSIFKSLVSSVIAKIILGLVAMSGIIGYVRNQIGTEREIFFQGQVWDYDRPEYLLPGIPIHFENRKEMFRTDQYGNFSGKIKVNSREKSIKLTCGGYPYEVHEKSVDMPIDDTIIETNFSLKHFGRNQVSYPSGDVLSN